MQIVPNWKILRRTPPFGAVTADNFCSILMFSARSLPPVTNLVFLVDAFSNILYFSLFLFAHIDGSRVFMAALSQDSALGSWLHPYLGCVLTATAASPANSCDPRQHTTSLSLGLCQCQLL